MERSCSLSRRKPGWKPAAARSRGFLRLPAPVVKTRTAAVLRLSLASPGGKIIHDTAVTVELFPPLPALAAQRVVIVGSAKVKAARLATQLGLRSAKSGELFLVDDMADFAKRRVEIAAAVKNGATAVFLELPAGEHVIGGDTIKVETCGMGARHFVSRDTDHPSVAGFWPEDFRHWYDPAGDRISPLLETCFRAEGWTPILTTGNGGWGGEWGPALAAAEKRDGHGVWRICQVQLVGRTVTNPVAGMFARRLVNTEHCPPEAMRVERTCNTRIDYAL